MNPFKKLNWSTDGYFLVGVPPYRSAYKIRKFWPRKTAGSFLLTPPPTDLPPPPPPTQHPLNSNLPLTPTEFIHPTSTSPLWICELINMRRNGATHAQVNFSF